MLEGSLGKIGLVRKSILRVAIFLLVTLAPLSLYRFTTTSNDSLIPSIAEEPHVHSCSDDSGLDTRIIEVNDEAIEVEVATEEADQRQGLSGRACLDEGKGMLFAYSKPSWRCFWMKDMRFVIDMVWIGSNESILKIDHDVQPETYPSQSFCADGVQYVLEVTAGLAKSAKWDVGTHVSL